jgi:hypothetical protein
VLGNDEGAMEQVRVELEDLEKWRNGGSQLGDRR